MQSVEIPCGVCTILCVESKRFVANAREVNVVVKGWRMLCFLLFLSVKIGRNCRKILTYSTDWGIIIVLINVLFSIRQGT